MCFGLVCIIPSYVPKGSCLGIWKSALDRNGSNASAVVVEINPDFCIPERRIRSDYEGGLPTKPVQCAFLQNSKQPGGEKEEDIRWKFKR